MRPHLPSALLALASVVALFPLPAASLPPGVDGLEPGVEVAPGALPVEQAYGVTLADLQGLPAPVSPVVEVLPRAPGTVAQLPLTYGPFVIPPGHDLNRVVLDVPLHGGFLTAFHYRLADAATGEFPTNMEVHIHHALWFRTPVDRLGDAGGYGVPLPVFNFDQLLFGTGEERTDIDFDARSDAVPGGPRYGVWFPGDEAQNVVVMLHNKEARARVVYLTLDTTFVYGDRAAIAAAGDCANLVALPIDAGCAAGEDFHRVLGRLWGAIFHVPAEPGSDGIYVYPPNLGTQVRYTAAQAGTMVAAWGHVHPEGRETVLVNLGSSTQPCGDLDGDGLPGITLVHSRKWDRNPQAWPHSEEFQMGGTKPGFRAPVQAGDRIAQLGFYDNGRFASYYQMTFAATHVDVEQPPAPRTGGCTVANTGPRLVDGSGGDPTQSVLNRPWEGPALPLCGDGLGPACDAPPGPLPPGVDAATVVIAGFAYLPGQAGAPAPLGGPVRVPQGQSLTFVNGDFGALVRHSVTACAWPCNGPYRANYPGPSGAFDSGNLGSVDLFNGEGLDPDPTWATPPDLDPGVYAYYCRLHPAMRGAFEVVPP